MPTMPVQMEEAPYIARNRPEPPALPALKDRHYHLAFRGEQGKAITQARWAAVEDAAVWSGAIRSPAATDEVAIDGNHYLTRAGLNPNTAQAERCRGGRNCPARDPASGTWLPIIGRVVPA